MTTMNRTITFNELRKIKESWFPQSEVVSDLKLRAGYGVTGKQARTLFRWVGKIEI